MAVAYGAAIRDAYVTAGYQGDPDNGWPSRMLQNPTVEARVTELLAARSADLLAAAPIPVGLPTSQEWLAEFVALTRKAS